MNNAQPSAAASRWPIWVAALGVLVFGLLYVAGGGYLATLGGSLYFLLAGLGMVASAVLLFKRRLAGACVPWPCSAWSWRWLTLRCARPMA